VWVCVCDPGLWSFTLQPRYKRPKHKNTVTRRTRMQKESAIKDSRNTFKHFIMLAMQVLSVCVCVCVCVFSTYLLMYLTGCEVVLVGGWRDLDVP